MWNKGRERSSFLFVALFVAVSLSLFGVWVVHAAVNEAALLDYTIASGVNKVKAGGTIVPLVFGLTRDAGETMVSTTFKINNISGITASDFNHDENLLSGVGAVLVKDDNPANDQVDPTDTRIARIPGIMINIGTTTTLDIDTDGNFENGLQAETIPAVLGGAWDYALQFVMSTTTVGGDVFSVTFASTTETYALSAGDVTSVGLSSANITIDTTAPTAIGGGTPPHLGTSVPPFAFIKTNFSESLLPSSVTTTATSSVLLQANTGNTAEGVPAGANLCSGINIESTSNIICNHSPLVTSTWYTYTITPLVTDIAGNPLSATSTVAFQTGAFNPDQNNTPPGIVSTFPFGGVSDFPINGNLIVEFPMFDSGNMATSGAESVLSSTNVILQSVSAGAPSGVNLCVAGCTLTFDQVLHKLKIDPTANLSANTDYALTLKKEIKNAAGVALNGGVHDFVLFFHSSAAADNTAPTFFSLSPANGATGVPLNTADIVAQFSKQVDAGTISSTTVRLFLDANLNSILDGGEEIDGASTSLRYDAQQRSVHIGTRMLLEQNGHYCIKVTTGVEDTLGNAIASDTIKCFTSVNAAFVATAPTVLFADADNFKLWVAFDQPVDPMDAMDKDNYTIENPVGTQLNLTNASFNYRPEAKGVEVMGLAFTTDQEFKVTVTGVRDLSDGATIVNNGSTNVGRGVVQDAEETNGFVGGSDHPDFNQTNFAEFAINPQRCAPQSLGAGKTTRFMCEFPVPTALTTGAKLILTFPTGFSIATSSLISAANSFMNADLNGPGPGVTTISAMATNTAANTITLTLSHSGTAMGNGDQLRFELDTVTNPLSSGEYAMSVIVKDSSGVKQGQTINTAPFMIGVAGAYSLSGTVCKGTTSGGVCGGDDEAIEGVKIFLDGGASGHQEATTGGDGSYSFTGLNAGQYNVGMFIDPSIMSDVGGGNNFQNISIVAANATNVDFKKADVSATGKTLTVSVTGAPASTDMDIFCFAPGNAQFSAPIMKKITSNGAGVANGTLKLQPNTTYNCGIGPHIPFESFSSGGPPSVPDFTFMPPPPKTVVVGSADLGVSFALVVSSGQVVGRVVDGDGAGIANVFVDARPMGCFDTDTGALKECHGGFTQTKSDGTFVLKVTNGTYEIGACAPGMPCSNRLEVTVKDNDDNADGNTSSDVYANGSKLTGVGATLKMVKSSVTISGQVQDESANSIKYAFVHATRISSGGTCNSFTPAGGDAGSPTDSQGNYTLYVSNGTWRVEAFADSYGQVDCSIITISGDTSKSSQNLTASASDYGTISGTVTKAGVAVQGANINCFGSSGGNHSVSGSDGSYSMKVKAGSGYRCDGFLPGAGPLTPSSTITVASGQTTDVDLAIGNPGTITITLGSTLTDAFCDARSASGQGNGTGQNSAGVYLINVPAGAYTVRCGNPRVGEIGSQAVVVVAGGSNAVSFTAPTLLTVAGRVTDGSNNLEGASITFMDKTNGRLIFKQSDATAGAGNNVSVSLPPGTYSVIASKSGYIDASDPQTLVLSDNTSFTTRSLTKSAATISATVQLSGSNYTGGARVIATKSDGKVVTAEIDSTVSVGANASLPVSNGVWSLVAFGDNGKKSAASTVTVAGNVADASPTLSLNTAIEGFTAQEAQQQSVVPSSGGLFKDTNISDDFELNIPSGALSTSDGTAGTIETSYDPTYAIDTEGKDFIGDAAIDITPKNSSGQKLSELSTPATINIPYDEADIPAGVTEDKLQCAAWSQASGDWETLSTTVDAANNVLTCQTTHFSAFGVVAATSGGTESNGGGNNNSGGGSSGGGGSFRSSVPTLKAGANEAVLVNSGVSQTKNKNVTLNFNVVNATQMAISDRSDFQGASYVTYVPTVVWKLSDGFGLKTIYIKFRSKDGGILTRTVTVTLVSESTVIAPAPQVLVPTPVTSGPVTASPKPVVSATLRFNKTLTKGMTSPDVRLLQQKLLDLGYVTQSSVTGFFGNATFAAVKKFQTDHFIPALGIVGPQTLQALNGTSKASPVAPVIAPAAPSIMPSSLSISRTLRPGMIGSDVREVQQKLFDLGYVDSKSMTGFYGPITTQAIKKFQKDRGITMLGIVGPQTLQAFGVAPSATVLAPAPTVAVPTPVTSLPVSVSRTLRPGMIGSDVRGVQQKLLDLGYVDAKSMTGFYGPITTQAVKKFQKDRGITMLGIVGPQTLKALGL